MVETEVKEPKDFVERNIALTGELMQYLFEQPHLFNSLPEDFELVILPDDDPEMRAYNLELLEAYVSEGKPIVFARLSSNWKDSLNQVPPSLYAPIAV